MAKSIEYRPEIDGLRSIAVLSVLFCHFQMPYFEGGYVGVDIFFVISGYLITSIVSSEIQEGRFSIADFYERRARRIFPALFFVVLVSAIYVPFFFAPNDIKDFFQSVIATFFFSSNFLFYHESGYFDAAAEVKPLLHTWSLAVEEQFYVFFPLFLIVVYRFFRDYISIFLGISIVVAFIAAEILLERNQSAAYFLLPGRAWELMVGAALSILATNLRYRKYFEGLVLLGVLLILYAIIFYDKNTRFPGVAAFLPVIGTALLIVFSPGTRVAKLTLENRVMVNVGLWSYSIYLVHQPIRAFYLYQRPDYPSSFESIAMVFLSVFLGWTSYRYIEQPFRSKKHFSRKKIVQLTSAFVIPMCALSSAFHLLDGDIGQIDPERRAIFESVNHSPDRGVCDTGGDDYLPINSSCKFNDEASLSWALIGDSHSIEIAHVLSLRLEDLLIGLRQFSFSNCPPTYGREDESPCSEWSKDVINEVISDDSINLVVISYRINAYLMGRHEGVYPDIPSSVSIDEREAIWKDYISILNLLVESGKKVVVVSQAPELPMPINRIIASSNDRDYRGVGKSWWDKRTSFYRTHLKDFPDEVFVVDPSKLFCNADYCSSNINKLALYYDDDHVSLNGASIIVDEILAELELSR